MTLNGKWILNGYDESGKAIQLDVTVPGCVYTDYMEAGLINDPYYRDNADKYEWVEHNIYTYEKTFEVSKLEDNAYIEFDGLDTYCDVFLNGKNIGEAHNMHIPHSFCVDGVLTEGKNTLTVTFRPPAEEVADMPERIGSFSTERMNTRRMQCTYGWDWIGRFVTVGIFKDVRLVFKKANDISNIYVYTKTVTPYGAQIKGEFNFSDVIPETDSAVMELYSPDGKMIFTKKRTILKEVMEESFDIPNPQLWFPNGYGKQPLYKLVISTKYSKKEVLFGIRELTVLQIEDQPGSYEEQKCRQTQADELFCERDKNEKTSAFTVIVNDTRIMCKGANWVPCEPFPSAETPEKITTILELAKDAGVNMIRVWGGGIFEQDFFYDECDRLGILVTQDFLMACGQYPEHEQWFIDELNIETKYAALRLRNHPCLAWWTGDNENGEWGTENITNFNGYYAATLGVEPVIKQYDKQRYFFPSSPYGGEYFCSATKGTTHNTQYQWPIFARAKDTDFDNYTEFFSKMIARFSVEQSCLGLPFVSSLKNFMSDEDIFGDDTTISEYHMKNGIDPDYTLFDAVTIMGEKMFGEYKDANDRLRKQQMLQCEWIRITFEAHRRNKWFSSGLVYWMLNDCWPAANGWSIIDYYAKPKPAYYTFKRCAQPVVASVENADGKIRVWISNDTLEDCQGKGTLCIYDFKENKKLLAKDFDFEVTANEAASFCESEYSEFEALLNKNTIILCDITSNLNDDRTFYSKTKLGYLDLIYPDVEVVEETAESITVKATGFTPYVLLDVPYVLEENCFTMLAGETKVIKKL